MNNNYDNQYLNVLFQTEIIVELCYKYIDKYNKLLKKIESANNKETFIDDYPHKLFRKDQLINTNFSNANGDGAKNDKNTVFKQYSLKPVIVFNHILDSLKLECEALKQDIDTTFTYFFNSDGSYKFSDSYYKNDLVILFSNYKSLFKNNNGKLKNESRLFKSYNNHYKSLDSYLNFDLLIDEFDNEDEKLAINYLKRKIESFTLLLKKIRVIEKLNLIKSTNTINKFIKGCYLCVSDNNICNLSISFMDVDHKLLRIDNNDAFVDENKRWNLKREFIGNVAQNTMKTTSFSDQCPIMLTSVNLNTLFNFKKNIIFKDERNLSRKYFYTKLIIDQKSKSHKFRSISNNIITAYKFAFNFYTSYLIRYKLLSFDNQVEEVLNYINDPKCLGRYSWAYGDSYLSYSGLENLVKYDTYNLFVHAKQISFGYCLPIDNINDKYKDNNKNELYNHQYRYEADHNRNIIYSSFIFLSLTLYSHVLLREKIRLIRSKSRNAFSRFLFIHSFNTKYGNFLLNYSSASLFVKADRQILYYQILNKSHLKDTETETNELCKNLWQEANLSNSKIFSLAAVVISCASLILAGISFYYNYSDGHPIFNYIVPMALGAIGLIVLGLYFIFILLINKTIKK